MVSWRRHISEADSKRPAREKGTFNSELGYWYDDIFNNIDAINQ